jgi:hypothetical protein
MVYENYRVSPFFDEPFYAGFNISGCEPGLDPDLTGVSTREHSVAYWAVDDIEAAVNTLTIQGAGIVNAISDVGADIKVAVYKRSIWQLCRVN